MAIRKQIWKHIRLSKLRSASLHLNPNTHILMIVMVLLVSYSCVQQCVIIVLIYNCFWLEHVLETQEHRHNGGGTAVVCTVIITYKCSSVFGQGKGGLFISPNQQSTIITLKCFNYVFYCLTLIIMFRLFFSSAFYIEYLSYFLKNKSFWKVSKVHKKKVCHH